MTTESEMFADISKSRMMGGSGIISAIKITTIAIGIAICDFIACPLCNHNASRQQLQVSRVSRFL